MDDKLMEQLSYQLHELQLQENQVVPALKQKLADEQIDSAIIIEEKNNNVKIRYILKDITMMDEVPQDLIAAINSLYTNIQISKLGLTPEELAAINPNFEFSLEQTEEAAQGNILLCFSSFKLYYNRKNF